MDLARFPGAVKDADGTIREFTFDTPVIPSANGVPCDIPAVWGNASLNRHRAVIDTVNRELVLCGKGKVRLEAPPGSWRLPMTLSQSGHWLVPMTCFEELIAQQLREQSDTKRSSSASGSSRALFEERPAADVDPIFHGDRSVSFSPVVESIAAADDATTTQAVQTDNAVRYDLDANDAPTDDDETTWPRQQRRATIAPRE